MVAEIGNAEIAHGTCAGEAQNHPGHADAAGFHQGFHIFGRHKARQNMRLAEIAQAPSSGGNNAHQRGAGNQAAVFFAGGGGHALNGGAHFIGAAQCQIHHNRRENQRKNHQRGLNGVGPAYGQKAADKGIGNGGTGTQPHGFGVADVKQALKQARAGHNAR